MKKFILLTVCLFISFVVYAQGKITSYVINVEKAKAYLDITAPKVKVGDVLSIREEAGYMIHPVTKKKIKKEGGILADLEIIELYGEYSIATIFPEEAISKIKVGMIAEMPELLAETSQQDEVVDDKKVIAQETIPTTVDGIIQRYLKVTGLEKWLDSDYIPTLCEKTTMSSVTKKGKTINYSKYVAIDRSAQKLHLKIDYLEKNKFLSMVSVLNGDIGWFRFKKGKTMKYTKKQIANIWSSSTDTGLFDLNIYDETKWTRSIANRKSIRGKECSGIHFTSCENPNEFFIYYYDDATGLIVYREDYIKSSTTQTSYLEYKRVGDILLCSKSSTICSEGNIKELTITLDDISIGHSLDNTLFTKDAVKNAFK